MSQLPYSHPARSEAWAGTPLPSTYLTALRLADLTTLRYKAFDSPSKAAEIVYGIPELRAMILGWWTESIRRRS